MFDKSAAWNLLKIMLIPLAIPFYLCISLVIFISACLFPRIGITLFKELSNFLPDAINDWFALFLFFFRSDYLVQQNNNDNKLFQKISGAVHYFPDCDLPMKKFFLMHCPELWPKMEIPLNKETARVMLLWPLISKLLINDQNPIHYSFYTLSKKLIFDLIDYTDDAYDKKHLVDITRICILLIDNNFLIKQPLPEENLPTVKENIKTIFQTIENNIYDAAEIAVLFQKGPKTQENFDKIIASATIRTQIYRDTYDMKFSTGSEPSARYIANITVDEIASYLSPKGAKINYSQTNPESNESKDDMPLHLHV